MDKYIYAAEQMSLFCRMNMNTKRGLPIRASEMGMLIYLIKSDGEKTPMKAAQFFKTKKSMATNMVSSLVRQGYLTKTQSEKDKRSYILSPTQKAVELVDKTYSRYIQAVRFLEESMGGEKFQEFVCLISQANTILSEGEENE